jgi:hypothetical protein
MKARWGEEEIGGRVEIKIKDKSEKTKVFSIFAVLS